ncbi:hypothetical protein [Nocardia sp. NPDC004722]
MATPTAKELESVVRWLETRVGQDQTGTLADYLVIAKGDLSDTRAEEVRQSTFAQLFYEAAPPTRPWDIGPARTWEQLSAADRRSQIVRAAPFAQALENAGWTKPPKKARTWNSLSDVPADVIVTDCEGDRWEYRGGKWGLGTGGNWGCDAFGSPNTYAPFREYLG